MKYKDENRQRYRTYEIIGDILGGIAIFGFAFALFGYAYFIERGDPFAIAFGVLLLFIGVCYTISPRVREMAERFNIYQHRDDDDEEPYF